MYIGVNKIASLPLFSTRRVSPLLCEERILMCETSALAATELNLHLISKTVHSPTTALFIKLGRFKLYTRIHTKYRSYMFRSSTIIRELVLSLAEVMLIHLCSYRLCGGVAACLGSGVCVVCAVQIGYVVVWQHVLGVACVLCVLCR
jgi:hypothetical protein